MRVNSPRRFGQSQAWALCLGHGFAWRRMGIHTLMAISFLLLGVSSGVEAAEISANIEPHVDAAPEGEPRSLVAQGQIRVFVYENFREDDYKPLSDVEVRASLNEKTNIQNSTTTDSNGLADFRVSPGKWRIQIRVEGSESANTAAKDRVEALASQEFEVPVEVDGDRVAQVIIRLPRLAKGASSSSLVPNVEVEHAPKMSSLTGKLDRDVPEQSYRIRFVDEKAQAISGVKIEVEGQDDFSTSSSSGEVQFAARPGQRIFISHPQFEVKQVTLKSETSEHELIRLQAASTSLEEFRILAPRVQGGVGALIEIRRQGRGVAEVLGSEQMSRSGDGDAAGNLRRVTGLTLVGGKYVYVRGLGERYSSILLNDAALSSPEPSRRVVPLDLFPTSVLETLIIEKAYTSDLPGEFGGGAIRIGTKPIPNQFFARLQVGANTSGSTNSVLGYQGGSTDYLGFDDGTRALPANVREATADGRRLKEVNPLFPQGFSPEQLQDFGRSFSRVWSTREVSEHPQPSMNAAIGQVWKIGSSGKLGGQLSMLYGRDLEAVEKESSKYSIGVGGKLVRDVQNRRLESESEVRWAATGDWGLQWDQSTPSGAAAKHRISMTNIWLKHSSNQASLGDETNANGRFRSTSLSWVERELLIQQARGEHEWNSSSGFLTRVRYRASRAQAAREAPDQRDTRYQWENEQFVFSTRADGNQRSFSDLSDETLEWGGDLKLGQKTAWGSWASTWSATEVRRDRESQLRRFHFRDVRPAGSTLNLAQPLERLFAIENISPTGFQILETTRETDNYRAGQQTTALATTVDLDLHTRWRLSAGARHEVSRQDVLTYNLFDPENKPVRAGLETRDVLPSITGTLELTEGHQLRAAYAETISRPDFKELSMAPYIDEETGQEVKGNARLRNSVIRHYDLRYEFYPSTEESLSLAIFRKDFDRPIEQVLRAQGDETVRTYDNARRAENDGVEIESRWRLRRWSEALRRFTIAGNLALIRSQIEIEPSAATVQTSNQRPLQGQSPWVVNIQLYYDHKTQGVASGLLFNVVGPRIREASTGGLPDVYEQAQPQLDYVMSWKFHQPDSSVARRLDPVMQIQFRAKNLLDTETRLTQGDQVALSYRRGRSFGLQLSAVF